MVSPRFPRWVGMATCSLTEYPQGLHACHGLNIYTFLCQQCRQGEEWYKVRRILNMKMLKPEVVGEYSQQLNEVTTDVLSQMKTTRDDNGIVPNIQQELFKWSLECELIHVFLC